MANTPALAEETPSSLMPKTVVAKIPPGYVQMWTLTIAFESVEQSEIAKCTKFLADNGFQPLSSVTTAAGARPVLRVTGKKDYAGPNEKADALVEEVKQIMAGTTGKLTWGIAANLVPAR